MKRVPAIIDDDLLVLSPNTPLMSDQAEGMRAALGRRHNEELVVSRVTSGDQHGFVGAELVVLLSDVDQDVDGGATIIVAAHYLRQVSRYGGPILAVAFSRQGHTATPPRLVSDNGVPGLFIAPMGSTPDQVLQLIRDHLRL